jgi:HEAT repeat protein
LALAWFFPASVYLPVGFVKGEATFEGKPTDYWAHALKKEGFLGQAPAPGDAGKTLRQGGAAAVPVLCELAQGPDDLLRTEALSALSLMGKEAKGAVPVLQNTLKTEKNSSRFLLAGRTLANVDGAAAGEALSAVLREKDPDFSRRAWAFTALLNMAPQGQEALPVLKDIVQDVTEDPVLRVQAIDVLWHMGQPADPLVPPLCEMLAAPKSTVGVQALMVLGEMGASAKSAVPTLLKVLERPDLPLTGKRWGAPHRTAIYRTLGQIGPDASEALPVLLGSFNGESYFIGKLERSNYYIRTEVGLALAHMGPAAKQAVIVRDGVWAANILLLAARSPGNLAVLPLVEIERRTWIPRAGEGVLEIQKAIAQVDAGATRRAGLPPLTDAD